MSWVTRKREQLAAALYDCEITPPWTADQTDEERINVIRDLIQQPKEASND